MRRLSAASAGLRVSLRGSRVAGYAPTYEVPRMTGIGRRDRHSPASTITWPIELHTDSWFD